MAYCGTQMTWDIATTTTPKARTQHDCGHCGRTIEPGETYSRTSGIWEGEGGTYKECGHCRHAHNAAEAIMGRFDFMQMQEDGDPFGVRDALYDHGTLPSLRLRKAIYLRWHIGGSLLPVSHAERWAEKIINEQIRSKVAA